MKNNYPHIEVDSLMEAERFFSMVKPPFEKSREEVWEALESKLTEKPQTGIASLWPRRFAYTAAAVIILLLGTYLVIRFYSVTVETSYGEIIAYTLPDGSSVNLNAGSELKYHPYWWRYDRAVRFEGEAFFDVEKGEEFSVRSGQGTTVVLGTSFTIYSRQQEYRVTCLTGSVKVISPSDAEVILSPEYKATIEDDGNIVVTKEETPETSTSWIDGMLSFTARSLRFVFDEIERQYGINIDFIPSKEFLYTGYFSKEKPVEEVMDLVCKPFGLNFVKRSEKTYEVIAK
jgi:ferric-dicitrate binding protein FerR (iron transport regulator)